MSIISKVLTVIGIKNNNHTILSRKRCYFCTKTNSLVTYTDGNKKVYVCPLCAEYAHRRAYRRI